MVRTKNSQSMNSKINPHLDPIPLTQNNMAVQYHKINFLTRRLRKKTKELHEMKDLLLSHENLTYIHYSSYLRHLNP